MISLKICILFYTNYDFQNNLLIGGCTEKPYASGFRIVLSNLNNYLRGQIMRNKKRTIKNGPKQFIYRKKGRIFIII